MHLTTVFHSGATLLGMAHMDELAYSLNGQNYHFGTPINKAAPGSVPGGSSSGSAVRCTLTCSTTVDSYTISDRQGVL